MIGDRGLVLVLGLIIIANISGKFLKMRWRKIVLGTSFLRILDVLG
jgi:hypothetical protein